MIAKRLLVILLVFFGCLAFVTAEESNDDFGGLGNPIISLQSPHVGLGEDPAVVIGGQPF